MGKQADAIVQKIPITDKLIKTAPLKLFIPLDLLLFGINQYRIFLFFSILKYIYKFKIGLTGFIAAPPAPLKHLIDNVHPVCILGIHHKPAIVRTRRRLFALFTV